MYWKKPQLLYAYDTFLLTELQEEQAKMVGYLDVDYNANKEQGS